MKPVSSALCMLILVSFARADNWPQWRGPENDGHSKEKGMPIKFDEKTNLAWKLPMPGPGGSTPIVWGERIFLTSAEGAEVVLLCIKTDGKVVWKKTLGPLQRPKIMGGEGNDATPSCSTDGKHVFTYINAGNLACYDFDGKEIWKFNTQERYGRFSIQHGMHVTPLLHGDRLYFALLTNGKDRHWVVAIDKATGKEIWKVARESDAVGESREAYTSVVLWQNGPEPNLVVLGCDYTTGHRLKDGAELWRLGDINPKAKYSTAHRIIASPVASADLLVVPTCRGLTVIGVKPGVSGSIKSGSPAEQWRIAKGSPDVSSPLIHDGVVYLPQSQNTLLCVDAKTGATLYNQRHTDGRFRASPVFADGNVYITGRDDGVITVLKAGRPPEELAKNQFADEVFTASPAIANGRIYLRGFKSLYAVSEGGK